MDDRMQRLATSFAKQQLASYEISALLVKEGEKTRREICRQIDELTQSQQKLNNFLGSLWFDEMYHRQDMVSEAYAKTFRWIFDPSGHDVRPWSNFVDWLKTGSKTYWINGKAGSGKSTLMNFIRDDPRTKEGLQQWAGTKDLIMPVFFFWRAGTEWQKSISGLLRSLLYQILKDRPDIIMTEINLGKPDAKRWECYYQDTRTLRGLYHMLERVCAVLKDTSRICMFIDGLDEFDEDYFELASFIDDLIHHAGVKCCVSSRPDKAFSQFESSSMLRLQDLTRADIHQFATSEITRHIQLTSLSEDEQRSKLRIPDLIVEKAEGVFLWVDLVVKSQIKGIRNGDDLDILIKRLEVLPSKIEDLYVHMLERIDPVYYPEAARYLFLTQKLRRKSILDYALAIFCLDKDLHLKSHRPQAHDIISKCDGVKNRIEITCGGFLEVQESKGSKGERLEQVWRAWEPATVASTDGSFGDVDWIHTKVSFHHRTASDFFDTNATGKNFISQHAPAFTDIRFLETAVWLAQMSMCQHQCRRQYLEHMAGYVLQQFRGISHVDDASHLFLKYLDTAIAELDLQLNGAHNLSHWCRRWGQSSEQILFEYIQPRKEDLNVEEFISVIFPQDFLSLIILFDLYEYASQILEAQNSCFSAQQYEMYSLCAMARPFSSPYFDLNSGDDAWVDARNGQLDFIAQLVNCGTRTGLSPPDKLWRLLSQIFYFEQMGIEDHLLSQRSGFSLPTEYIVRAVKVFLSAGANPFPIITLMRIIPPKPDYVVFFEIDTAKIPPIFDSLDAAVRPAEERKLHSLDSRRTSLRIWYRKQQLPAQGTHTGKAVMLDHQSETLHEIIASTLNRSPGGSTTAKMLRELDEQLRSIAASIWPDLARFLEI